MAEDIAIQINGRSFTVPAGSTVAAAVLHAGVPCRTSVTGEPRSALCGMGICFECRVTIDGRRHRRGCQTTCQAGMEICSDD